MKWFDFNEIIEDRTGNNPKLKVSDYRDYGTVPVIDQGKKLISGYSNDETLKYRYNKPLIIFGDHTCIFKYVDFPFILGADGVKALELKSNIETKYIYYYLNTIKIPETGYDRHFKYLKRIKIPLPPLETQKKIATILDKADELRQNDKKILEKYDQLAQSVFLEMFGDPIRNSRRLKIVRLEDITIKITDGVHAKPNYVEKGVPFISVKDITTGVLEFDNCKYISKEDHLNFTKRCKPEYDDILYTKVGATYGRPALVDKNIDFSIYVSVALIKPKRELVNSSFLKEALAHPAIKRQADKAIKGIGVPDLHLNMIKEFVLPLPTLELQEKYASIMSRVENQKKITQESLQKSEKLFQSLLQRAFRGDLVQD